MNPSPLDMPARPPAQVQAPRWHPPKHTGPYNHLCPTCPRDGGARTVVPNHLVVCAQCYQACTDAARAGLDERNRNQ